MQKSVPRTNTMAEDASSTRAKLRLQAEQRVRDAKAEAAPPGTEQDTLRLLHELQFVAREDLLAFPRAGSQGDAPPCMAADTAVVERHGKTIRVESEPGRGSTFFFPLPDGT